MAHIQITNSLPGISGLLAMHTDTAKPLVELANLLLFRESSTFSMAERETVAAYVSYLNQCVFCSESHAAVADFHWDGPVAKQVWESPEAAPISARLKTLLVIAGKVQKDARSVTSADVAAAIAEGATEKDVHDAVLISAAFNLYNRYVDGLATFAPPRGDAVYRIMGERLGRNGYLR